MNKFFTIIVALVGAVFWLSLSHADISDTSIVGKWAGIDSDGDSTMFVFSEDKSADVKFQGVPLLSTKTMTNGTVEWSRNTGQDSIHLDIVILIGSIEKRRIPMIAQFVDERTLKIQISRDMTTRPKGFSMSKEVFQILATKQ